jgi:hypothetical protein
LRFPSRARATRERREGAFVVGHASMQPSSIAACSGERPRRCSRGEAASPGALPRAPGFMRHGSGVR